MSGRRALVTGASRGIGRAVAISLAEQGHHVAGVARSVDGLAETVAAAGQLSGTIRAVPGDLSVATGPPELVDAAEAALGGPVEILVHAAGIVGSARLIDLTLDDWNATQQVNVTSAFLLTQRLLPAMLAARWGRLVTIGSLYSRTGGKFAGAYAASKHALLGLTRVAAAETASSGVTANCVVPGWTDTDMVRDEARHVAQLQGIDEAEAVRRFLRGQPLGRLIEPREVGALVAFLCGDAAAAITGQAVHVDGGSLQA
jgi:NAD(P)-dependent dehydrogenase (short-subunit alcohol dehydrogenase family)